MVVAERDRLSVFDTDLLEVVEELGIDDLPLP